MRSRFEVADDFKQAKQCVREFMFCFNDLKSEQLMNKAEEIHDRYSDFFEVFSYNEKSVMMCLYFYGMTSEQTAKLLHITPTTVNKISRRCIKQIACT